MIKSQIIDNLKKKSRELQQEISSILKQEKQLHDEILRKRVELSKIDKKLSNLTKDFKISDHALLRYFERVYMKKDKLNEVKSELMNRVKEYSELGDCDIKIDKKYIAVIRDNVLVTIKDND